MRRPVCLFRATQILADYPGSLVGETAVLRKMTASQLQQQIGVFRRPNWAATGFCSNSPGIELRYTLG
jgi:hypothetical protein